jgi:dCTP deaminase
MLSAPEIAKALALADDDSDRLVITPLPNLHELSERSATSVDLRLGRWFKTFKQSRNSVVPLGRDSQKKSVEVEARRTKEHFVPFGEAFVLHPGGFVLGGTLEWLRLPSTISGYVTGKSTLGRHGLIIETASGIHPHFSGCLTLELANVGKVPIEISPGMKVCQVFLHRVAKSEQKDPGNMMGRRKPNLPPPRPDKIFEAICATD